MVNSVNLLFNSIIISVKVFVYINAKGLKVMPNTYFGCAFQGTIQFNTLQHI